MNETIHTHHKIDRSLCGHPVHIEEDRCTVELTATPNMAADDMELVHGGFIFGLADYAAMLAVNHPNVVLGAADVKFLRPVKVGDRVIAEAQVEQKKGKKQSVAVRVSKGEALVFEGNFTCFVLEKHVLS